MPDFIYFKQAFLLFGSDCNTWNSARACNLVYSQCCFMFFVGSATKRDRYSRSDISASATHDLSSFFLRKEKALQTLLFFLSACKERKWLCLFVWRCQRKERNLEIFCTTHCINSSALLVYLKKYRGVRIFFP